MKRTIAPTIFDAIALIDTERQRLGMSVTELARRAGKPQPMVWEILNGGKACGFEVAAELGAAVGLAVSIEVGKKR